MNEDYLFTRKLSGEPVGDPWESLWDGADDWEFRSAADDSPEQLYAFWDETVQRPRARLDAALARAAWISSPMCPPRRENMRACAACCAT